MKKGPFILFRVFGALLVLGLIIGAGAFSYKAGMMRGIAQAPAVAAAIEKSAENGQVAPVPPMYAYPEGYGYGNPMMYGHHHFGFFPIGAICGSFFFLFFFFGFMKMIFFRRMWHGRHGHHGHHHGPWMRGQECEENKEGEKKDNEKKDETPEEKK
jgi:hypothetical protein